MATKTGNQRRVKGQARKESVPAARKAGRPKSRGPKQDLATRRVILEAALQTFSLYGFDGASITRIARLHQVSPPLIHYYFKSKDALWRAAMDQGIGAMITDLEEICREMVEADCIARLKFFIRRYLGIVAERRAVFRVIVRESDMPSPRLTWLAQHYMTPLYSLIAGLIEEAQNSGRLKPVAPPYHMAQIITGACYHFLASRNRLLETYGIDVDTREIRELHGNAVIEILFAGMLTPAVSGHAVLPARAKS
jgi:TetR/AcrR family transcriptional regulator